MEARGVEGKSVEGTDEASAAPRLRPVAKCAAYESHLEGSL